MLSIQYPVPPYQKPSLSLIKEVCDFLVTENRRLDSMPNDGVNLTINIEDDDQLQDQTTLDNIIAAGWTSLSYSVPVTLTLVSSDTSILASDPSWTTLGTIVGQPSLYGLENSFIRIFLDYKTTDANTVVRVVEEYNDGSEEQNILGSLNLDDTSSSWKSTVFNCGGPQAPAEARYSLQGNKNILATANIRSACIYLVKYF